LNALVSAFRDNGVDIKMNGNRVERGNNDNSERNQQRSSDHRRSQSNRAERDEVRVSGFERASYADLAGLTVCQVVAIVTHNLLFQGAIRTVIIDQI